MKQPFTNITIDDMKLYIKFMEIAKELRLSKSTVSFCRKFNINHADFKDVVENGINMNDLYRKTANRVIWSFAKQK